MTERLNSFKMISNDKNLIRGQVRLKLGLSLYN